MVGHGRRRSPRPPSSLENGRRATLTGTMCNSRTITPLGHLLLTVALAGPGRLQAQVPPYTATDFPPAEGYYYLTTLNFQGNNQQSQMLILDGAAQVAFRRTVASASSFRPWPDGRMSYATVGQHLLLDGSFAVIDTVTCAPR